MKISTLIDFIFSIGLSKNDLADKICKYLFETLNVDYNEFYENENALNDILNERVRLFLKNFKTTFRKDCSCKKEKLYEKKKTWLDSEFAIPVEILEYFSRNRNLPANEIPSTSSSTKTRASYKLFDDLSPRQKLRKIQPILNLNLDTNALLYATQHELRKTSQNDLRYLIKTPLTPKKVKGIKNIYIYI